MKAIIALLALISFVSANPGYGSPAPPPPPPPAPAPAYGSYNPPPPTTPSYNPPAPTTPAYNPPPPTTSPYYQPPAPAPKYNCSIDKVTQKGEVCVPTLQTACEDVNLVIKQVVDGQYCYESVTTVCTETTETIDNEICTFTYSEKYDDAAGKSVNVVYEKKSEIKKVSVCQQQSYSDGYDSYGAQGGNGGGSGGSGYGSGYQSYSPPPQPYCKDVDQEVSYNIPYLTPQDVPVQVSYPVATKSCVNKPITLPRVTCQNKSEQKCISQPEVKDYAVVAQVCAATVGANNCQKVDLTLPQQVCKQVVYQPPPPPPQQPQPDYYKPQPEPQYKPSPKAPY